MARIRAVKPEFWSSPDHAALAELGPLDPWARLLYIAMWNWADDNGRGTANPRELAGFAFPNEDWISTADVRRMLGGIRRAFGVIFYEIRGRSFYAIPSWSDHQKIDHRGKGRWPGPDEGKPVDPDPPHGPDQHKQVAPGAVSTEPTEIPPRTRSDPGAGTGEQGNRGTGDTDSLRSSARAGALRAVAPLEDHEREPESEPEPINAGTVVAAWVEEVTANGTRPSSSQRNQVGKIARELLRGNPPDAVLAAARAAGARGFPSIDRELTAMAGRAPARPPGRGDPVVVRDTRTGDLLEKWW